MKKDQLINAARKISDLLTAGSSRLRITVLLLVLIFSYLATGMYSLRSGQSAVVIRFGRIIEEVATPGIHYHFPYPVENVRKVHVSKVETAMVQPDRAKKDTYFEIFTGDENLIKVRAVINYDVKELKKYLFSAKNVEDIIESSALMCLSQELAYMNVDVVMTTGKSVLKLLMKNKVQSILDSLDTGVRVISIDLTEISPPKEVSQSFKDVSDAREKKQEIIKEAEGFANSIVPKARGNAGSLISEAEAYAKETVYSAQGNAKIFNDILKEYYRSPAITKKVKYLETLKKIQEKSTIHIDANPANSVYYVQKSVSKKK